VAAAFMAAVAAELAPTGLALTLLTSSTRADLVPARDLPMDGALVYSCEPGSPSLDWLLRRKVPLVFVDQERQAGTPSVNIDDRGGAAAAARHVVELGHRRIGIVTSAVGGETGLVDDPLRAATGHVQRQRMLGWTDELHERGIEPLVCQDPFTADDRGEVGGRTLLDADPSITAILCFSDVIAAGVCATAADLGRRVPQGLSVVGFDDNPMARRHRPALTTVRQDVDAKGRASAATLVETIERARTGHGGRARHVVLPTELIVRASTAPPPP
jgi:DNA-binding LacI/PurR family transcriptional regulator